jgi:hypothetical protein
MIGNEIGSDSGIVIHEKATLESGAGECGVNSSAAKATSHR